MSSDYHTAATAVASVIARRKDVKGAVYAAMGSGGNVGRVMALVSRTVDKLSVLQSVLARLASVPDCSYERGASLKDDAMLLVLLYEHAFGRGIRGGGALKRLVTGNDALIKRLCSAGAAGGDDEDASESRPRYARVNTLCSDRDAVLEALCDGAGLDRDEVVADEHVCDLLRLPADAHTRLQLHSHPVVTSGALVLQDKASTFTAAALLGDLLQDAPPSAAAAAGHDDGVRDELMRAWPWQVLDACAAPGNKTSHAAALMAALHARMRTGTPDGTYVHAYERDVERSALLQARLEALHAAKHVVVHTGDCLSVSAASHPAVRLVLLDPSCSGSGMRESAPESRKRARVEAGSAATWPPPVPSHMFDRVEALASFQVKALVHMLSLPSVLRVAYSTCSVYEAEDEAVVARALAEYNASALAGATPSSGSDTTYMRAVLVPCLPTWPRRGVSHAVASNLTPEQAACVVRVHPQLDASTGFFVALVQKVSTKVTVPPPSGAKSGR